MTASHLLEVRDLTVDFLSLGGAFAGHQWR